MWDLVLQFAARTPHPLTVALCGAAIAIAILVLALRAGDSRIPRALCFALAVIVITLAVAPIALKHVLRSQAIFHVRIVVLRPDGSSADIAQVKSSDGRELTMVEGGWELDVPPQFRPADGMLTFSATVKDEFLDGSSTLVLANDYYPTATVHLVAETSAKVRGVVVDEDLGAVAGATVSIPEYPDVAVTDRKGNFVLPAHAGKGQIIEVRAQKGQLAGRLSAPAGKVVEIVLTSE